MSFEQTGWEVINTAKLKAIQERNSMLKKKVLELEKETNLMKFIIRAQSQLLEDYVMQLKLKEDMQGS